MELTTIPYRKRKAEDLDHQDSRHFKKAVLLNPE